MLISVIIPTCHRNDLLAKCLDCLAPGQQTLLFDQYEVVVTDDGVKGNARKLIESRYPWARWTEGPHRGPAANRNHGARQARGEWLAFVDDDCLPEKSWLACIAERISQGDVEVIEGRTVIPDKRDSPMSHAVENQFGGVFWSCNLAVLRSRFLAMGGFDEDFLEAGGEDMEFAWRLQKEGIKAAFLQAAVVRHPQYAINFRQLFRRIWMHRWLVLYYYKTGQGLLAEQSLVKCLWIIFLWQGKSCFKGSMQLQTRFKQTNWKTTVFDEAWKWCSAPLVLGCLWYWTVHYYRKFKAQSALKRTANSTGT